MYLGTLPAVSNRATYIADVEIVSDDTGDAYDISAATEITIAIREQGQRSPILIGTMTGGEITLPSSNVLRWTFSRDQMATLCNQTYDVGVTIEFSDETEQIIIATLPVLDGVVSR